MKPSPRTAEAGPVRQAIEAGEGILRLAPTWVPRSFLMPGRRIKLRAAGRLRPGGPPRRHRRTLVRLHHAGRQRKPPTGRGAQLRRSRRRSELHAQGGGRLEGAHAGRARPSGRSTSSWPVYSKFFDNLGPIPHHMHQNNAQAAKVGQQGKPESYYFPPQLNALGNNFPYTFFGLEPGTTKADIRRCLENWNKGDNGILNYSKAYRLQPGTGWLVPPCVLHAPGLARSPTSRSGAPTSSPCTSRWSRAGPCPGACSSRTCPPTSTRTSITIVEQLDWEANVDPQIQGQPLSRTDPWPSAATEGLRRSLDRLRQGGRRAAVHRQGADRRSRRQGDHQGQRAPTA